MKPRHALSIAMTVTVLAATAVTFAQTTRRAAALPALEVSVYTCTDHDQFRMRQKGQCPLCEQTLVRTKVAIQGPAATSAVYPLETCPVSGLVLGDNGTPVVMMHEGREVRLCSAGCIKKFMGDPAAYLAKIDKAIIEQQRASYPMTTCPISHQSLDAMGKPVDLVYNNRLVRFCCSSCVRQFTKDPAPALAELDQAIIAVQTPMYPLTACPISGQGLTSMGGPIDLIAGNRLVRFCCAGCIDGFYKAPAVHLAKLEKAWTDRDGNHGDDHDH